MTRLRRDESGSSIVEMALIAGTLFTLMISALLFTTAEVADSAGSNAAVEGARSATLDPFCADAYVGSATFDATQCPTVPSATYTAIVNTVTSHLAGLSMSPPTVAVECLWGETSTSSPANNPLDPKSCDSNLIAGVDLVRVTVTWTRVATNPTGSSTTKTDSATMTVQASGAGTTDTTACLATATVSPSTVGLVGGASPGELASSATLTVDTNGYCTAPLSVSVSTGLGSISGTLTAQGSGSDFSYVVAAQSNQWAAGTYLFVVTDGNGNALTFVAQPQLTVTGTACQFVSASLSPGSVVLNGSSGPAGLLQAVTVNLTTTSTCGAISTQFSPDGSTAQSQTMTGSAGAYTLSIAAASFSWTTGSHAFGFTDVTDGGVVLKNEQSVNLIVSVECAVAVSLSPATVSLQGSSNLSSAVTVTATPSAGADCSGLAMTYASLGGTATVNLTLQSSGVYQATISKNANSWSVGTWPITLSAANTSIVGTSPSPVDLTVH